MPVTTLDPVAALVSIDLQKGIVSIPAAHPIAEIVARTAQLAHAFRQRGLPVVLVNVAGRPSGRTQAGWPNTGTFPPDWADLVPELDAQPTDHLVTKHSPGAFANTSLQEILQKLGVTQIFFTGVATSLGVESTARAAFDLGYNVVCISDAMTDRNADSPRHSIETIFPRLAELDTTENVLALLAK